MSSMWVATPGVGPSPLNWWARMGRSLALTFSPVCPWGSGSSDGRHHRPLTQERILAELEDEPLLVVSISPHHRKMGHGPVGGHDLVADVLFALPLLKAAISTKLFRASVLRNSCSRSPSFLKRPPFSRAPLAIPHRVYLVCKHHTPWKACKASVREHYGAAVNRLVGGDEIETDPEPVASSFRVRENPTMGLKNIEQMSTGHEPTTRTVWPTPANRSNTPFAGSTRCAQDVSTTDDRLHQLHRTCGRRLRAGRHGFGRVGLLGRAGIIRQCRRYYSH